MVEITFDANSPQDCARIQEMLNIGVVVESGPGTPAVATVAPVAPVLQTEAPAQTVATPAAETTGLTPEALLASVSDIASAGHGAAAQALLAEFGAPNISGILAERREEFLATLKERTNA